MKQAPIANKLYKNARKRRLPVPEVLANAPRVYPWLWVFRKAFSDLIGDRLSPESPIAWTARQKWAEVHGLDETATELLHTHVAAMDLAFLGHKSNKSTDGGGGNKTDGNPGAVRRKHAAPRRTR